MSNVFANNPAGPRFGNKAAHLRPEVTVIRRAAALPGNGKGLAGKAAGEQVNAGNAVASESVCGEGTDVFIEERVRPMVTENTLTERSVVTEGDRFDAPRPASSQSESANARKEIKMMQGVYREDILLKQRLDEEN